VPCGTSFKNKRELLRHRTTTKAHGGPLGKATVQHKTLKVEVEFQFTSCARSIPLDGDPWGGCIGVDMRRLRSDRRKSYRSCEKVEISARRAARRGGQGIYGEREEDKENREEDGEMERVK
jgi:hypothetical protein